MNKIYGKLATTNIKNSKQFYLPYLLTGMMSVAMFYLMTAMQDNPGLLQMSGGANVKMVLSFGIYVVGLFTGIFLFYTNSFIMKRRKKELGVYNILGMEKKHLACVLFLETLITFITAMGGGLAFGILFQKLLTMLLYKLTGLDASIPFYISKTGCINTAVLFCVIYAAALLYNLLQIKLSNPIELLHGTSSGEREPKTKVLLAIVGFICLGGGYYMALRVEDASEAVLLFFLAVILVILGTYCLFTAGSIAFLKLLRKNKKYYYQTRHFTTVSGMIYRMKQNAVGLANICILSTMVLVTVSTTICMYLGSEDALNSMYPMEITGAAYYTEMPEHKAEIEERIVDVVKESGHVITGREGYLNLTITTLRKEEELQSTGMGAGTEYDISDITILTVLLKEDYEKISGEKIGPLGAGEAALAIRPEYEGKSIAVDGVSFVVKETCPIPEQMIATLPTSMVNGYCYLIVPDETALMQVYDGIRKNWDQVRVEPQLRYDVAIDIEGSSQEKKAVGDAARESLANWEDGPGYYISTKEAMRSDYYSTYGGMLFLGLFLGTLFLMVTVLIIFYKQISEGYDDRERYAIMEKVGMSNDEVKKSIRSQILTVFFLPIVVAVIHVVMAFPMIRLILSAFNLTNIALFTACVAGTALVFFVIYLAVFLLTSRSYYKIVGNQV